MGVDYTANYGIGVQIPNYWIDGRLEEDGCVFELLDNELHGSPYVYWEVGSASYSGGRNDFYISIKDPFSNGVEGLAIKIKELELFLKEKGIDFEKVDLVGGLNIW